MWYIFCCSQNTDKRLMFGYWSSFIPDTQGGATMASAQTLFTIILKDPAPKVRTALGVELLLMPVHFYLQLTLVISKSKGLSEILRDIHTLTYQSCRTEEKNKLNKRITQKNMLFDSWSWRYTKNIVEKRRNCSLGAVLLFHYILLPDVRFSC